jgi:hypothetical protein
MLSFRVLVVGMLVFLAGCHTSPDVRDVAQIDTVEIIRNIRCEVRDAVATYDSKHWINTAAIAYGFTFNALEKNGIAGGLTFTFPVMPAGKWVLGLDAGVSRHREGENVVDLGEILGNLDELDCSSRPPDAPGYPITGRVGLKEVIDAFVAVNAFSGVLQKKFTRSLRYELRMNGGIKPSISVIPAPGNIRDGTLNAGAERQDVHKLLIALVPPTKTSTTPRVKGAPKDAPSLGPFVRRATPPVAAPASVDRALQALDAERRLRNDELILQKLGP